MPLVYTPGIQSGPYFNLHTGQTTYLTAGITPEPGTYFQRETLQVVMVITDLTTGLPVVLSGTAPRPDLALVASVQIRTPNMCR